MGGLLGGGDKGYVGPPLKLLGGGGGLAGPKGMLAPLSNYWGGGGLAGRLVPPPFFLRLCRSTLFLRKYS